jgi:CHAT domain-containing protein/tetratricopeptide (TPR) repeat protein
MSPSPVSSRCAPRFRGASSLFPLLAALLCGAAPPPATPGTSLADGLVLERELKGGETHVYPVDLQAGQFLRVRVQEDGIDLAVRLLDPQGAEITGMDGLEGKHADEDLAVVGSVSGPYRVEVKAPAKAAPGRYRLRVEGPRAAGGQDAIRAEAVKAVWDANQERDKDEAAWRRQIASFEHALSLWRQLGESRRMAETLYFLAYARSNFPDAAGQMTEDFKASAALWESQPDSEAHVWQWRSFNSAGKLLKQLGRPAEARRSYEEALAIARAQRDSYNQATTLNNLGILDCDQGEPRKGIESLTESLAKAREIQDKGIQASDLINLAFAYEQIQEDQKALEYDQEALALARAQGERDQEATALNNLGGTYLSIGDWETSIQYFHQALPLIHEIKDRLKEAKTLINLGDALRRLKRFDEAGKAFDQALALGRETKDAETQTAALTTLAFLYVKSHQADRAVEPAREALRLAHGFPEWELNALYALGSAHRELGDSRAAREELGKALSLAHLRGDRSREAEIDLVLARAERDEGDLTAAREQVRSALEIVESIRTRVLDPRLRTSFLATKQDFYELYIDSLMPSPGAPPDKTRIAEAFQISEQARARSLLDVLSESGADIRKGADPALVDHERRLRDAINTLEGQRFNLLAGEKPDRRKLDQTERKLAETFDEYNRVQADLRAGSTVYAALTQPQPLTVEEIQGQILDGKAMLLEYSLGEKRSFLWVVTPDSVQSFELPGRERIETMARRYYEQVTARNQSRPGESPQAWKQRIDRADADAERVGRDLSRLLLTPAERLLGDRLLIIVADGALQYIPFAALPLSASGAPLATRHEVVSLPSASALAVLRRAVRGRSRAPKALAIFADPVFQATDERLTHRPGKAERQSLVVKTRGDWPRSDARQAEGEERPSFRRLPSSLKEARTISSLVPPDQLFLAVGFDASRAKAISPGLAQYRNVHFATHGVLDSRRPELSKLVLSLYDEKGKPQNGFLLLNDIYSLNLDADLVVLSACRTALGKEVRGEGLIGLTRGFMDAGAARVLASLWSVEDRATADLMGSFYRAMLRQKLSPAAALRRAQLEMAARPGRRSPYYWAGFSLQGEWR